MIKKLPACLLLFVLVFNAAAQIPAENDRRQKLLLQLKTSKADTGRAKLLLKLSDFYMDRFAYYGDKLILDTANTVLNQALQLSNTLHNFLLQGKALEGRGDGILKPATKGMA